MSAQFLDDNAFEAFREYIGRPDRRTPPERLPEPGDIFDDVVNHSVAQPLGDGGGVGFAHQNDDRHLFQQIVNALQG